MTTRQPPSFLNQPGRGKRITARDEFPGLPIDPHTGVTLDPDAPDDLEPLPDAMQQLTSVIESILVLRQFFLGRRGVLVDGDTPVYYLDPEGRQRIVRPDCYVALGVDPIAVRRRNGYFIERVGRPMAFALEIASESTFQNDLGPKRELYARLGIGEYWRFDGTGGEYYGEPLVGETLLEGAYHRLPIHQGSGGHPWGHSPTLGLDLCGEPERLRFFDPASGVYLRNLAEAEAARQAAEAKVERLTEELRRLRG